MESEMGHCRAPQHIQVFSLLLLFLSQSCIKLVMGHVEVAWDCLYVKKRKATEFRKERLADSNLTSGGTAQWGSRERQNNQPQLDTIWPAYKSISWKVGWGGRVGEGRSRNKSNQTAGKSASQPTISCIKIGYKPARLQMVLQGPLPFIWGCLPLNPVRGLLERKSEG